ncbi:MAG TPA: ATP-binding protein [Solirubrobacteraceae bacterium]|nr:ATP-binding protein [Solirubrobacteraceae bacterium]
MALSDEQIFEQNPWWTRPGWRAEDPHLGLLDAQPARLSANFVADLDLRAAGIHTLRGPRQVGKSTDLKLLVERALGESIQARSIVYLALDLLEGRHLSELAASVRRALDLSGRTEAGLLLLDEVTAVRGWQTAVKSLWDQGQIREDVVVCTGSSAIDLQRGAAERLPGRRRAGFDHLVLPQSFAAFARALDGDIPSSPGLTVAELRDRAGEALLRDMRPYAPALERTLDRYLRFGGLPAAVAEAAGGAHEPSDEVRRVLWDSLVRELQRKGASVPATHALLERVVRSLGAKVSWSAMAREMEVPLGRGSGPPSHVALRDYIELLAAGYFLFVAYFWRAGSQSNAISKDKKVFFADPLLHTIALERSPGLRPDTPALVENAVAIALLRRYEPADRLIETFVLPEQLHIWQTARGGEIDFVCGPRRELDLVEVKYRELPGLTAAAAAARAQPGRPVVMATRSTLHVAEGYTLLPAHTLLWALG